MKFVISSGHGLYVRGASDLLDEVDEARRVVPQVCQYLREHGHEAVELHEDKATTQEDNLENIVQAHNAHKRDMDLSVHFNCYIPTDGGRGTETLYVNHDIEPIAAKLSAAIASAGGLINRGAHHRSDLFFLNKTTAPALILEVAFCDAKADVDAYFENFDAICRAIADQAPGAVPAGNTLYAKGKCSWFGGPDDLGVQPNEGLAFIYKVEDKPVLFLPEQPEGTTGLARRLDPDIYYIAMRWDYDQFPKDMLRGHVMAIVRSPKTGRSALAHPADWGPHISTSRVADISPGLMDHLGLETDDMVEVEFPYEGR